MENFEAAAKSDAASKNSVAAIQRCNQLEARVAALTNVVQQMEQNYIAIKKVVDAQVMMINLIKAQTSYGQIEQRILPKIMAEIEASKDD